MESTGANITDFDAWEKLLAWVDVGTDAESTVSAYEGFLEKFPCCFGYWHKYAEAVNGHAGVEAAIAVYERCVEAIPLCIDGWLNYCRFMVSRHATPKDHPPEHAMLVEQVFDRAIKAAGMDWKADKLWREYMNWSRSRGDIGRLGELYQKIFALKQPSTVSFFGDFQMYAKTADLELWSTPEERAMARESAGNGRTSSEMSELVKETVLASRQQLLEIAAGEIAKRQSFESKITRDYFHVQQQSDESLENWRAYLKFEECEAEDNDSTLNGRVIALYERCLIACALYEEFWLRYVIYLERHDIRLARRAFERGAKMQIFPAPSFWFAFASFEEAHGSVDTAREMLQRLVNGAEPNIEAVSRLANLERRQGNAKAGLTVFEAVAARLVDMPLLRPHAALAHANFLAATGDVAAAAMHLAKCVQHDLTSIELHLRRIDFELELHAREKSSETEGRVHAAFKAVIDGEAFDSGVKRLFLHRYSLFVDENTLNTSVVRKIHLELAVGVQRGYDNTKRKASSQHCDVDAKRPLLDVQQQEQQRIAAWQVWQQQQQQHQQLAMLEAGHTLPQPPGDQAQQPTLQATGTPQTEQDRQRIQAAWAAYQQQHR